jgi:hypothetical protein
MPTWSAISATVGAPPFSVMAARMIRRMRSWVTVR